mgnify:CR=1 FL=1|jgi:hypothetical protein
MERKMRDKFICNDAYDAHKEQMLMAAGDQESSIGDEPR